ncbi:MAG: chromosome segregation protein SMC [Bacteroidetes bacterium]|nr:chromosome segregation protein SMC [Bacteroidota bacterium]
MYLSKLEVHGFKSFAQKTLVRFDSGITAIVGPNGCGKTNVADAIRWVLGEQKASTLRSDKMENVIFNGTRARKPLGMAEVSLTIENTKNILPTEYTDVTITRRLYRSGESEYLLNKIPCRLKDIVDLFMDTGMGPDAYSVIELKMIEDILSERYDDRRKLFEEAAGVTKYKARRKQSQRKLEQTRHDLERINDIILEVGKTVGSLERQAKKAELYEVYRAELQKMDLEYAEREYAQMNSRLVPLKQQLDQISTEIISLITEIDTQDAAVQRMKADELEMAQALSIKQKEMNQADEEINKTESGISVNRTKKIGLEANIQRFEQEKIETGERLKLLSGEIKQFEDKIANWKSLSDSAETAYTLVQETNKSFETLLADKRKEAGDFNSRLQALNRELTLRQTDQEKARARKDSTQNRIESIRKGLETQAESLDEQTAELDEFRYQLKKSQQALADAEILVKEHTEKLQQFRTLSDDLRSESSALDVEIQARKHRQSFQKSIFESYEGIPEGARFLLKSGALKSKSTFSDVIKLTDESWLPVVTKWLGERSGMLIASNEEDAVSHLNLLKKDKKGLAGFFLLNRVKSEKESALPSVPGAVLLSDLIKTNAEYKGLANLVFWGVYGTDSVADASRLSESYPDFTFLTKEGVVFSDRITVRGGESANEKQSRIGVAEKIAELDNEIESLLAKKSTKEEESQSARQQFEALKKLNPEENLIRLRRETLDLERKSAQIDASIQAGNKRIESEETEIARLSEEVKSLNEHLEELLPEIDEFSYEIKKLQKTHQELVESLTALESEWLQHSRSAQEARAKMVDFQGQLQNAANERNRLLQQDAELNSLIIRRDQEIESSRKSILQIEEEVHQAESRLIELLGQRKEMLGSIEQAEIHVSQKRGDINRTETVLRDIRKKKDESVELGHEMDKKLQDLSIRIETLQIRIREEYAIEMELKSFPDEGEFDLARLGEEARRYRERIKNLGQVNTGALQEYTEQKERYEFMITQRDDLTKAEADLQQIIEEINQTAQLQFQTVFTQIRENFSSTFSTLFEPGDEADLILEDTPDALEAKIEIIAKPRGKRPQSITLLSGGEKTLTAIALLFAIYLVKPSPFCILDEVDAPLDDANIDRFSKIIKRFSADTQFIIITHNKRTMEVAQMMYGVTMEEKGVSKLVSVKFDNEVPV